MQRLRVNFLHGWGFGPRVWDSLLDVLPPRFEPQCLVIPGYDRGDRDRIFPPVDAASIATPPAIWIGWSLGGQLLAEFAAAFPERVRALILVATPPRFLSGDGWPCGVAPGDLKDLETRLQRGVQSTLVRFARLCVRESSNARQAQCALDTCLRKSRTPELPALLQGIEMLRSNDLRAVLTQLSMPTLFISGGADLLVPPSAAAAIRLLCPGVQTVTIDGAGHAPFLSHPEEFAACMKKFLS